MVQVGPRLVHPWRESWDRPAVAAGKPALRFALLASTTRKHYCELLLLCRPRCFDARAADLVNMGAAFLPALPGGAWHQDEVEQHKTRGISI